MAKHKPESFAMLLTKVLPMQITPTVVDDEPYETVEEAAEAMRKKGFNPDLVDRLFTSVFTQRIKQFRGG